MVLLTIRGKLTSGQGSARGAFPLTFPEDVEWSQTRICPPGVLQATLRIGWIPDSHHAQWQIELEDPVTRELLAMRSSPHLLAHSPLQVLQLAMQDLERLWIEVADPDPF